MTPPGFPGRADETGASVRRRAARKGVEAPLSFRCGGDLDDDSRGIVGRSDVRDVGALRRRGCGDAAAGVVAATAVVVARCFRRCRRVAIVSMADRLGRRLSGGCRRVAAWCLDAASLFGLQLFLRRNRILMARMRGAIFSGTAAGGGRGGRERLEHEGQQSQSDDHRMTEALAQLAAIQHRSRTGRIGRAESGLGRARRTLTRLETPI